MPFDCYDLMNEAASSSSLSGAHEDEESDESTLTTYSEESMTSSYDDSDSDSESDSDEECPVLCGAELIGAKKKGSGGGKKRSNRRKGTSGRKGRSGRKRKSSGTKKKSSGGTKKSSSGTKKSKTGDAGGKSGEGSGKVQKSQRKSAKDKKAGRKSSKGKDEKGTKDKGNKKKTDKEGADKNGKDADKKKQQKDKNGKDVDKNGKDADKKKQQKDKKKKKEEEDKKKEEEGGGGGEEEGAPEKRQKEKPEISAPAPSGGGGEGRGSGGPEIGGGGGGGDTYININQIPLGGVPPGEGLVGVGGNPYTGVAGAPAGLAQGLEEQQRAQEARDLGYRQMQERLAYQRQAWQAEQQRDVAEREVQRLQLANQRLVVQEQALRDIELARANSRAEKAPIEQIQRFRSEAQAEALEAKKGPMVRGVPTDEDDIEEAVVEGIANERRQVSEGEKQERLVDEMAELYGVPKEEDAAGRPFIRPTQGPYAKAFEEENNANLAKQGQFDQYASSNPNLAADNVYQLALKNPQFNNALRREFAGKAPGRPRRPITIDYTRNTTVAASSIAGMMIHRLEMNVSGFELPIPTKISGQDRSVRDIMQFFASACSQFSAYLDTLNIKQMEWDDVFLLVLNEFAKMPGTRMMCEAVPLQLWANRYHECGLNRALSYLFFQVTAQLAFDLITLNIVRRSNDTQLNSVYAEKLSESIQKHIEAFSKLFSITDPESKSALTTIVMMLGQGTVPSVSLFDSAFKNASSCYTPIAGDVSKYAIHSRSMVDAMRMVQDVVEALLDDKTIPMQQFLTSQSWLVPTSYVGRMGLTKGVTFAGMLKVWLVSVRTLITTGSSKSYDSESQKIETWLRQHYGDEAGNLWLSYAVLVEKKKSYHTSYVDNLPAIGLIIDQRVERISASLTVQEVLIRSRLNVLPSMPIEDARTPSEYNEQIGLLMAHHTPTIADSLDGVDADILTAHNDTEEKYGDLVDEYLYTKAAGKEYEAQQVQGEIFSQSMDMDTFEESLSEQNRNDVSSLLANYENEACKRVGEMVAKFRTHKSYHIDLNGLSMSVLVVLRAVLKDVWKCDDEKCQLSKLDQDFLWSYYTRQATEGLQVPSNMDAKIIEKVHQVYNKDQVAYRSVYEFVTLTRGLMDSMSFIAQWAYHHPVAKNVLFNTGKANDKTTISDLAHLILSIPESEDKFWNSLHVAAVEHSTVLTQERKKFLIAHSKADYGSIERVIYSILLCRLFCSKGEVYDKDDDYTLYYSGNTTLETLTKDSSSFCSDVSIKVRTLYGANSTRYRFADHLRLARFYKDRSSFMAHADSKRDEQRSLHNHALLEEIIRTTKDEDDVRLYRQLMGAVLEERPVSTAYFFIQAFGSETDSDSDSDSDSSSDSDSDSDFKNSRLLETDKLLLNMLTEYSYI